MSTDKPKLSNIPNVSAANRKKLGLTGPPSNQVGSQAKIDTHNNNRRRGLFNWDKEKERKVDAALANASNAVENLKHGNPQDQAQTATGIREGKGNNFATNPWRSFDTEKASGYGGADPNSRGF